MELDWYKGNQRYGHDDQNQWKSIDKNELKDKVTMAKINRT